MSVALGAKVCVVQSATLEPESTRSRNARCRLPKVLVVSTNRQVQLASFCRA